MLETLTKNGTMPTTRSLIKQGRLHKMNSSLPPNSATSWNSMITGKGPGEHGVYGFTDFIPGTLTLSYHHLGKLKQQPFWKLQPNRRTIVINLPASYPPAPMNGVHISGFVSPNPLRATYPTTLHNAVHRNGYKVDINEPFNKTDPAPYLHELHSTLEKRVNLAAEVLRQPWDTLFFTVTGTDRIGHQLYDAYADPRHPQHDAFLDYFHSVDNAIEQIISRIPPGTPIIMLSDHGMGPSKTTVNLNTHLRDEGLLKVKDSPELNYNAVQPESSAFAVETHKVYLNRNPMFPQGHIKASNTGIVDRVEDTLLDLEVNGRSPVQQVIRGREVYAGAESRRAPDLIVIPAPGFSFKTSLFSGALVEPDTLTGTHTHDDAFLLVDAERQPELQETPRIRDVQDVMNHILERS